MHTKLCSILWPIYDIHECHSFVWTTVYGIHAIIDHHRIVFISCFVWSSTRGNFSNMKVEESKCFLNYTGPQVILHAGSITYGLAGNSVCAFFYSDQLKPAPNHFKEYKESQQKFSGVWLISTTCSFGSMAIGTSSRVINSSLLSTCTEIPFGTVKLIPICFFILFAFRPPTILRHL